MHINRKDINNILVIKLRGIGDVILSTLVFENLKNDFPEATIDYLTEKPSFDTLNTVNLINKIHIFNRKSLWERIKLLFKIRAEKYDLILDLFSNPSTAQITAFSGAKYKAGFPYKGRKYAYNLYGPEIRDKYHSADLHLEFLKEIGISHQSKNLHFGLSESDKTFAEKTLTILRENNSLLICLSPSGGWASKKCDPWKFAEIGKTVKERFNTTLLILWGPGDKEEAFRIKEILGDDVTLAPPTSIGQMGAILSLCDAVIANDSGPMHISTAVGTPTLSIHGPTNPKLQGPYGDKHEWIRNDNLDCIECNLLECPKKHECFTELPTESIVDKFAKLLHKNHLVESI